MKDKFVFIGLFVLILALLVVVWIRKMNGRTGPSQTSISADSTDELWYKNSVIYTLDVEVFKDSDGDGVGDFKGLTSKLSYIDSLGADVIWLAPFQPTPGEDDGYDIMDFYQVDERLGTFEDFTDFFQEAKKRKIRVIMDLVTNHTSDRHPWFQLARKDINSPYRAWYVWSKERPANYDKGMVFPGVQKTIWTYDSVAGEYYYHRFYKFQPDLNSQHPPVQKEMEKIIKHWMDFGLSGFRLDAVPFYIEVPQKRGEKFEREYDMLTKMHNHLRALNTEAAILGEANVLPDENKNFFGENGERMHMMFNFFVNQHLFYALATGEVTPLRDALERTKEIPKNAQWGQFLRNHDEVDLGRLSKRERERVYEKFGAEENMRLYDRGIRRRLAPMLNNDREQLELAYSLLFALPSTPVIRYGDEIGMGDDLRLQERLSVRTPMQWTAEANAGFSTSGSPVRPVISAGEFGYRRINVEKQKSEPNSLLHWTAKMARLRKECAEIAFGTWTILDTGSNHVLAILYQWNNRKLLVVHNFSDDQQSISLQAEDIGSKLTDLVGNDSYRVSHLKNFELVLDEYDYKWLRVGEI